jgi:hypothetical protein
MVWDRIPRQGGDAMADMGELLDHVPQLVKAYGRWPSFLYLIFATAVAHRRRVIFAGSLMGLVILRLLL